MKNTIFSLIATALAITVLAGCIEETVPLEGAATSEQMAESSAAMQGSVDGMVAQTYQPYYFFGSSNQLEYDISYAGLLITYARMTNDLVNNSKTIGYDWWCGYVGAYGYVMNADNNRQLVPYMTLYKIIKSANDIIGPLAGLESLNAEQKIYLGTAYAYRALMYHDLYNMYLPALNDYTDCSKVDGLTVPIIVSSAEETPASKTARAPKKALSDFVIADLDKAEALLDGYTPSNGRYPGIAVVYGLKARMYLAIADYDNAATYARKAITASGKTPLTEAQWHDPKTAFCDANGNNSWMWYYTISGNNMGNLCNPTGFLAGEADWGYNSLTQLSLHKWLYDRMNGTDFRKRSFIDPDRTTYNADYYQWADKAGYLKDYPFEDLPDYFSIKIRCKEGNWQTYSIGGAVDWPMMRVEEMYLIEAEAVGMRDGEAAGAALLEDFVKTYRDPSYTYVAASATFSNDGFVKNFQEEVLYQKRIEFLGEGVGYFDAKRIRPGMKTWYAGSKVIHDTMKYDVKEVSPYWNFVIPTDEIENNEYILVEDAVTSEIDGVTTTLNNPDPTKKIENETTVF
ncbi:MAG: RagB/SusD family nutrient uptake outer membrane protein [Bacteroidales bacterium]|nr:RagB/SusD family nutrient uptake outer membrane protein [Bacteroidales bacterium]